MKATHCKNGHEFNIDNTYNIPGTNRRACRVCRKLACRQYVLENGESRRTRVLSNKQMMREKKAQLVEYKGGTCVDCGGIFPACCYHFDHRNPLEKSRGIAQMMHRPIEEVKSEADKCDLVCANCHAIRTYGNASVGRKISESKLGKWKD